MDPLTSVPAKTRLDETSILHKQAKTNQLPCFYRSYAAPFILISAVSKVLSKDGVRCALPSRLLVDLSLVGMVCSTHDVACRINQCQ